MVRMLFLLLVVVGALAVVLGTAVRVGVVRQMRNDRAIASTARPANVATADPDKPAATRTAAPETDAVAPALPDPAAPKAATAVPKVAEAPAALSAAAAVKAAAAPGEAAVTGVSLVKAGGVGKAELVGPLADGAKLNLKAWPATGLTLRAEVAGPVASVRFAYDGRDDYHVENRPPFFIAGDADDGRVAGWRPRAGEHTLEVIPYATAGGPAGRAMTVRFTVGEGSREGRTLLPADATFAAGPAPPAGAIVLRAGSAEIKGDVLRTAGHGDGRHVAHWRNPGASVEWSVEVPREGTYAAELVYACEKGQGGDYVLSVGDHTFTGHSDATGDWETYKTVRLGEVALSARTVRVRVRAAKLENGRALMNLKSVRLVPKT